MDNEPKSMQGGNFRPHSFPTHGLLSFAEPVTGVGDIQTSNGQNRSEPS
jgi:hypothetical protein